MNSCLDEVKRLLEASPDLTERTQDGNSLFHLAASVGSAGCLRLLLQKWQMVYMTTDMIPVLTEARSRSDAAPPGELLGTTETSVAGRQYLAFLGVPYARPPLGDLRFRRPLPALYVGAFRGDEDCLYANVYTPALPGWFSSARDVLVVIPGGAFNFGSAGPEQLGAGLLMDEDLVLVTFNYRVGPLGFLTTEDEHAAGNYGLHDQVQALRWCLRAAPARRLIDTLEPAFRRWSIYPLMFAYRPRVERDVADAFLPEEPRTLLERGEITTVPWLAGVNRDEGGTFGCFSLANASAEADPAALYRRVRRFYFGRQRPGLTTAAAFVRAEGDRYFVTGVDAAVRLQARHGAAPVFKYVMEQRPTVPFPAVLAERLGNSELPFFPWGIAHKDELRYLFTGSSFPESEQDRRFARALTNVWATFVKTGRPGTTLLAMPEWPPYAEQTDVHMRLSEEPSLGTAAFGERLQFWQGLPIAEGWRLSYRRDGSDEEEDADSREEL
ncbi:cocaine esterase-like [Pollicipes pollicipes]|uniref:cocaine esterase-like n=1 Tax=Pollicipes pollicipes TaxID=41117 RepID=UPI00188564C7|nr:cocaine esterase-like [Pollicipes pollicipes]